MTYVYIHIITPVYIIDILYLAARARSFGRHRSVPAPWQKLTR